jgi:uncharacterized surface protein with fasciclin (FAS1) repeats
MMALTSTVLAGPKHQHDIVDTAVKTDGFSTLVAAVKAAGLVETLKGEGPFTVFAPTDAAFAKLPEGTIANLLKPENKKLLTSILTYHVVPGKVTADKVVKLSAAKTVNGQQVDIQVSDQGVMIDGAKVTATDIACSNGVIHVIDSVIMPSSSNIVETAVDAGSFKTLVAAVKAAGLAQTLSGEGPFTVFAPTDEAFAKLPQGTVESLLKPENKAKLVSILTFHVVPGRVFSGEAVKAGKATTVEGGTLHIHATKKGARVNDANLVKLDIDASNGVIHVVDTVLLPGTADAKEASAAVEVIELAIRRGVPMFNGGDAHGCAAVYEVAAHGVMALAKDDLCHASHARMSALMKMADNTHDATRRAWVLRSVLDTAHASLTN